MMGGIYKFGSDGAERLMGWDEFFEEHPPTDKSGALPAGELSWERILQIEPRLRGVEREIAALRKTGKQRFCANALWYGYHDPEHSYRGRVTRYTGWSAEKPELRSPEAYDIAYEHLYDMLPNCRHDGWCG